MKLGRLAMRREGLMWNAYYALPNTMDGAVFIGAIALCAVMENEERKNTFTNLMADIVAEHIEDMTGQRPEMNVIDAPEHERSGNA